MNEHIIQSKINISTAIVSRQVLQCLLMLSSHHHSHISPSCSDLGNLDRFNISTRSALYWPPVGLLALEQAF